MWYMLKESEIQLLSTCSPFLSWTTWIHRIINYSFQSNAHVALHHLSTFIHICKQVSTHQASSSTFCSFSHWFLIRAQFSKVPLPPPIIKVLPLWHLWRKKTKKGLRVRAGRQQRKRRDGYFGFSTVNHGGRFGLSEKYRFCHTGCNYCPDYARSTFF